jgi:PEP-CTERM motif
MNRVFILAAGLALTGLCASASPITLGTFAINAQASFLYESANDTNVNAVFLSLASINAVAGETIQIIGMGTACYAGTTNCPPGAAADLGGVFDSNNVELASSSLTPCSPQPNCTGGNVDRLTGTLNAGTSGAMVTNNPSLNTYYGNVNTTIPNDFYIPTGNGITLVVPTGAVYLVVGVLDSYYGDNSGSLSFQVNEVSPGPPSPVPEPATFALVGLATVGLAAFRRYRSR